MSDYAQLSKEIIDRAGGPTALASLLGLSGQASVTRICNWRNRGIPSKVWLDHAVYFNRMRKRIESEQKA